MSLVSFVNTKLEANEDFAAFWVDENGIDSWNVYQENSYVGQFDPVKMECWGGCSNELCAALQRAVSEFNGEIMI